MNHAFVAIQILLDCESNVATVVIWIYAINVTKIKSNTNIRIKKIILY